MFLSTDAGFSLFFVIKIILMSFFCQLQNTGISHEFVTNYEKFLPDCEKLRAEIDGSLRPDRSG